MIQQNFNIDQQHIFQDSIDLYGVDAQIDQAQEEAIELALAIRKYKRAEKYGNHHEIMKRRMELIDEIADVIIMTQQLRLVFSDMHIQDAIHRKLNRQSERLAKKSHES